MKSIILCGNKNDNKINRVIERALIRYKNSNEVQLFEYCDFIQNQDTGDREGIFIFKDSFFEDSEVKIPSNFITVFSSENLNAAYVLKKLELIAISCGISLKDTISVASIDDYSAMISIQRNIYTLDGKKIEPYDFCVSLSEKTELYPCIVASLVLILLGVQKFDGYLF